MERLETKEGNGRRVFVARFPFERKDVPKSVGFRWHGGNCWQNCPACAVGLGKVWWTDDPEKASKLIAFADDETREILQGIADAHDAALAASKATSADLDIPAPEGCVFRPFQKAAVRYALQCFEKGGANPSLGGCLIADEMG